MSDDADRIAVLELGPDDDILKPFDELELLVRVHARCRRRRGGHGGPPRRTRFGPSELVKHERHLSHADGRPVTLTSSEAQVMRDSVAEPGLGCSREASGSCCRTGTADRRPAATTTGTVDKTADRVGLAAAETARIAGARPTVAASSHDKRGFLAGDGFADAVASGHGRFFPPFARIPFRG